jgi:hypothetical protein
VSRKEDRRVRAAVVARQNVANVARAASQAERNRSNGK